MPVLSTPDCLIPRTAVPSQVIGRTTAESKLASNLIDIAILQVQTIVDGSSDSGGWTALHQWTIGKRSSQPISPPVLQWVVDALAEICEWRTPGWTIPLGAND